MLKKSRRPRSFSEVRLNPGFCERSVQQLAVNKCSLAVVVDRSNAVNKGEACGAKMDNLKSTDKTDNKAVFICRNLDFGATVACSFLFGK